MARLIPLVVALAALATLVVAVPAMADMPVLSLAWDAPDGCPTATEVEAETRARLGGSWPQGRHVAVEARAAVLQSGRWRLTLVTREGEVAGERTLEGATCSVVASAASLVIALTIDPEAVASTSRSDSATPPPPPPSPAPAPPREPDAVPAPRTRVTPFGRISTDIGAAVSADPISLGADVAFGARLGAASIELGFAAYLPQTRDIAPGAGADFFTVSFGPSVCLALLASQRFEGGPCAGIEARRTQARGHGVVTPEEGQAIFGVAVAGGSLGVALSARVWLVGRLDAGIALNRPSYLLLGVGTVYTVSPVSGRMHAGVELRF
jgi:hypothetical protein